MKPVEGPIVELPDFHLVVTLIRRWETILTGLYCPNLGLREQR